MEFLQQQTFILAKLESTYGTDSSPAAGDLIPARDISVNYAGNLIALGNLPSSIVKKKPVVGSKNMTVSFTCDLVGAGQIDNSGQPDDDNIIPPLISPLLQSCGLGLETVGTSPITAQRFVAGSTFTSCTIYIYQTRNTGAHLLHKMTGCRGNVNFNLSGGEVGTASFNFTGILQAATDATALAGLTTSPLQPPTIEGVSFTVDGETSLHVSSLTLDVGNAVNFAQKVSSSYVVSGSRDMTGSLDFDIVTIADYNPFDRFDDNTEFSIDVDVSSVVGNQYSFSIPKAIYTGVSTADVDNVAGLTLPFTVFSRDLTGDDRQLLIDFE